MPVIDLESSGIASGQGMVTCGWGGSGVAVGAGVGLGVAVGAGAGVGRDVAVGIGVAVGTGVGLSVGTGVAVGCGVEVGVGLGAAVGAGVAVGHGVAVGVGRGVAVGTGVSVGTGEGGEMGVGADAALASVVWRIPAAMVASMLAVGAGVRAWVGDSVAGGSVASGAHARTANRKATPARMVRSLFSIGGMVARNTREEYSKILERLEGLDGAFSRNYPVLSCWASGYRGAASPCLC